MRKGFSVQFLATLLILALVQFSNAAESESDWIASWGVSPFGFLAFGPASPPQPFEDQTLRQKLRLSAGGDEIRIRFSNELGSTPLTIGAATVALAGDDSAIENGSLHGLTFGGQSSVTIPPGAPALSDPVDLAVEDLAELAVSIYLPETAAPATMHMGRSAYVAAGDQTSSTALQDATLHSNHYFLTAVYVSSEDDVPVLVAFGDSITDGTASTPHTYNSWPDQLAERTDGRLAIVNAGIAGNQLLNDGAGVNAQARFDRDVLSMPGLTHLVVLEGINDIGIGGLTFPGMEGPPGTEKRPEELIAAYQQLINRAHAAGIKIIGATLLPFAGTEGGYYTPAKDEVRKAVNEWIRNSGAFDAVIDFDAAVRDPDNPDVILDSYDSGDHLHPGDAGYEAMADYIDPELFGL